MNSIFTDVLSRQWSGSRAADPNFLLVYSLWKLGVKLEISFRSASLRLEAVLEVVLQLIVDKQLLLIGETF
jgi:hypothetical protein